MFRREGGVFLLGTTMSAPYSSKNRKERAGGPSELNGLRGRVPWRPGLVRAGDLYRFARLLQAISFRNILQCTSSVTGFTIVRQGERKMLDVTLITAALLAFVNIWLGYRVGQIRTREKVSLGDAGKPALVARIDRKSTRLNSSH